VLRETFGPKREEVTEGWIKIPNEEFLEFFLSSVIIRVIKPMRMSPATHVTCVTPKRRHTGFW
jgi:hypothetical protein